MAEAIGVLKEHGINLPPDTTEKNFFERVCIVGHALKQANESALEDEELDEEPGEEEENLEGSGKDYGQTQEEQRPVLMSLSTAKTDGDKKRMTAYQNRHRTDLLALLARLVKRKAVTADEETKFRARIEGYELSLTEEGDEVKKELDFELSTIDKMSRRFAPPNLKKVRVEARPEPPSEADARKAEEEAGDDLADRAVVGARK